jgi:hypothetical protein
LPPDQVAQAEISLDLGNRPGLFGSVRPTAETSVVARGSAAITPIDPPAWITNEGSGPMTSDRPQDYLGRSLTKGHFHAEKEVSPQYVGVGFEALILDDLWRHEERGDWNRLVAPAGGDQVRATQVQDATSAERRSNLSWLEQLLVDAELIGGFQR